MKKLMTLGIILGSGALLAGCNEDSTTDFTGDINVYTRDTDSGTREGFFAAIDASDAKRDNEYLISGASEVTSNGDMISKVKADDKGIGYISLTSLEESELKGLKFDGIEASEANVLNGNYKMSRDFAYVTIANGSSQEALLVEEFNKFLKSTDGEAALISSGVIVEASATEAYTANETVCSGDETSINIGGSTSVEKAAKALSSALNAKCSAFSPSHAHTGSGDSEKVGAEDENMHIGFSSSGIRSGWTEGTTQGVLGKDAIVAVVNKNNPLESISKTELQEVFVKHDAKHDGNSVADNSKNVSKWEDLIA